VGSRLRFCARRDLRWEIVDARDDVVSNFVHGVERLNLPLV
jgi:hypothetical protein